MSAKEKKGSGVKNTKKTAKKARAPKKVKKSVTSKKVTAPKKGKGIQSARIKKTQAGSLKKKKKIDGVLGDAVPNGASKKMNVPPIVALGASAGGLDAFTEFFSNMPHESGIAFVVVAHLDPNHVSILPELLQKSTAMNVYKVHDGMVVDPNAIYIIPPNKEMSILSGTLLLMDPAKTIGPRLPIDSFFRSLAKDQGSNAVCIILSGTGTDGTLGLKEIKGEMGMVMAQDERTAKYVGMPRSAAETGLVDYILPPKKMPEQLIQYVRHPVCAVAKEIAPIEKKSPNTLQKIMVLLRQHTGHDFSVYKQNTICRRIERRMNVHQIRTTKEYVRLLQENPCENEILFKELLIGVTNFFRDPKSFDVLKKKVFPTVIKNAPKNYCIRIWVPGCSSGEEVYSIAIILREVMEAEKMHVNVQIFGTDIDESAIALARAGLYPCSIRGDVSDERLHKYFVKEGGGYRISKNIREMVVFATQNIIKDPPFTKLDLISCRNLLIYLNADVQKKIMPLFAYSLKPGGVLMLGSSETVGAFTEVFAPIDKKWKIFSVKKSLTKMKPPVSFPITVHPPFEAHKQQPVGGQEHHDVDLSRHVEKCLLKKYAPAAVVVNQKGTVVFVYGRTGKYLEPATGEASLNIGDMTRESIRLEMASGIRNALSSRKRVVFDNLQLKVNGGMQGVNLVITPVGEIKELKGLLLITFEDVPLTVAKGECKGKKISGKISDKHIRALEQELKYTKENLQTTIEELETSNEELKSSNEELQSTNEELQSTNEELETSKEELQSLNEELTTVNSELQGRIDDMTITHNDMKNLLDSTEIATIFLDTQMHIRRFTPKATEVINLIPSDVGRELSHIVPKVRYEKMIENARTVLRTLVPIEAEVAGDENTWYQSKIMPYRTVDNRIDGVVILFDNITSRRGVERALKERQLFLDAVLRSASNAIVVCDKKGTLSYFNQAACELHGLPKTPIPVDEAIQYYDIYSSDGTKLLPAEERPLSRVLNGEQVENESYVIAPKGRPGRLVHITGRHLADTEGKAFGAVLSMQEVTTERNGAQETDYDNEQ